VDKFRAVMAGDNNRQFKRQGGCDVERIADTRLVSLALERADEDTSAHSECCVTKKPGYFWRSSRFVKVC
jgi:hypothetical protein